MNKGRVCKGRAGVAQLVEQRIRNAKVGSSTLLAGTSPIKRSAQSTWLGFVASGLHVASGALERHFQEATKAARGRRGPSNAA